MGNQQPHRPPIYFSDLVYCFSIGNYIQQAFCTIVSFLTIFCPLFNRVRNTLTTSKKKKEIKRKSNSDQSDVWFIILVECGECEAVHFIFW